MKYKSIYVAASSQHVGKTTSTLGLVSAFHSKGVNVGYCKPVGQKFLELGNLRVDKDALLFADLLGLNLSSEAHSPVILGRGSTKEYLDSPNSFDLPQLILDAQKELDESHELVVYEGTGHPGVGSIAQLSNARVAKMLGAQVILVVEGGIGSTIDMLNLCLSIFREEEVPIAGIIINKVRMDKMDEVRKYVGGYIDGLGLRLLGLLPYDRTLAYPVMKTVASAIGGAVTHNPDKLGNRVADIIAGSLLDFDKLGSHRNLLLVVATRFVSDTISRIDELSKDRDLEGSPLSGIVLTGQGEVDEHCIDYVKEHKIPLIRTQLDTLGSVIKISRIEVKINRNSPWKVQKAIELIQDNVDLDGLLGIE